MLCNWCNIRKHWSLFFFFLFSFSSRAEKGSILLPMAWYPPSRDFLQEWWGYWTGIVSTSLFYSLRVMAMVTLRNFWSFWHLANTPSLKDLTSTVVVTSVKMMQAVLWEWTSSCRSWGRHQLIGPPSNWHQILLYTICYGLCFESLLCNISCLCSYQQLYAVIIFILSEVNVSSDLSHNSCLKTAVTIENGSVFDDLWK